MDEQNERMRILEMIEAGEISAAEGVRRLDALVEPAPPTRVSAPPAPPAWLRRLWLAVFWCGVILLAGGGLLLTAFYAWEAGVISAICGWPMLAFGLLVLLLGVWMQRARWLSVLVQEEGGHTIPIAFPLPLGPLPWLMRIVRRFVPEMRDVPLDEVIDVLREELRAGHPFAVAVNEGGGGNRVHVYFG